MVEIHSETKFSDPDWIIDKGIGFMDSNYRELLEGSAEVDQRGAFEFLEGRLKMLFPEVNEELDKVIGTEGDSFQNRVAVVWSFLSGAEFFRTS